MVCIHPIRAIKLLTCSRGAPITEKETAAGAVDDARPDRWGERVIRFLDRPPRLSLMEYLLFAGDDRFGALGVSVSGDTYQPRRFGPLPKLADVAAIQELIQKIINGESVPADKRRLVASGVTLGGARPKALLDVDGHQWIVKFSEPGEPVDMPLVEHATMTLAARAGIRTAKTMPVPLRRGHAVAVKRFDREIKGARRHALSARVVLGAAGEGLGYPELAQIVRRRGVVAGQVHQEHMRELFRRMVFNILMDNTDDHEKNHVLLMNDRGEYELAPAFDVLPSGQALGYQQMRVGTHQQDSTLVNALSEYGQFALTAEEATKQVRKVSRVVAGWKTHFTKMGVSPADIESLSQQIDRPFLREQRLA